MLFLALNRAESKTARNPGPRGAYALKEETDQNRPLSQKPSPATLFVQDPCHSVAQGLSNLTVPENHLEDVFNPVSDFVGLGWDTRTNISNRLPGDAAAAGVGSTLKSDSSQ